MDTMGELIAGLGTRRIVNKVAELVFEDLEENNRRSFDIHRAIDSLISKIEAVEKKPNCEHILIRAIGTDYEKFNEWGYKGRFFLFEKSKLMGEFVEIPAWNVSDEDMQGAYLHPALKKLETLSPEDVNIQLGFALKPQGEAIDWQNLGDLLNYKLGGFIARNLPSTVVDFISIYLNMELGVWPKEYSDNVEKYLKGDFTKEERMNGLVYDVLFNRWAIYREMKSAYEQLRREKSDSYSFDVF